MDEEIEILRGKSNEDLMKMFATQLFTNFTSTSLVQALGVVMEERKIDPGDMIIIMPFTTPNGIREIRISEC